MSRTPHALTTVAAVAAFATLCPAASATSAKSKAIHCGQVIKRSTKLRHDLVNCPGTGLKIGADGVTLDLGGHRIGGTNASGGEGISVDGHAGVTIRHGSVGGFRLNGVAFRKSPRARVYGLKVAAIGEGGKDGEPVSAGILADHSLRARIRQNVVSNQVKAFQSDGIVVIASKRASVVGNDSSKNAWNGIVLVQSPFAAAKGNVADGNQNNGIFVANAAHGLVTGNTANDQANPDTAGIAVLGSTVVNVRNNKVARNAATGIALEGGTKSSRVAGNTVRGGGDGIALLDADNNGVTDNDVQGVDGVGIALDAFGDKPNGSDGNNVTKNHSTGNGLAGFLVAAGSDRNVLKQNVASRNRGSGANGEPAGGILIDAATENHVISNTASGNTANGVQVKTAGNTLTGNTALDNMLHGIDAVAGTTDGGTNHASGNSAPPQCSGVVCS